jgi:SAM-dependent methyltransferase
MDAAELYDKMYSKPEYRRSSPGLRNAVPILAALKRLRVETILDVGCGLGWAVNLFNEAGFSAKGVDPSRVALPDELGDTFFLGSAPNLPEPLKIKHDLIFSCDVMEHIEPENIDEVLASLAEICGKYAYFAIALFEDRFHSGLAGIRLHPSIFTADEWKGFVSKHFIVSQQVITKSHAVFMCNAKGKL